MTSKIVIKDATLKAAGPQKKIFKVVKLTNYKNVDILGELYTTEQLKKFLSSLSPRVTYEILGNE
ncbi:uncharacterized protein METZ01_LOCUS113434 [marine metagenome]|uniref:Uncharacterized protein n=1 Tax=marine metagenome TaxID=408172 RepID=A0A381X7I1_9ZZZZ|tara:strand:+ start:812 stop:1006 length:195 start_codon:yes stop_codon:yes gene_type:complete